MATEVRLPPIAADTNEGTFLRWLVPISTAVKKGDLIAEIETAKAVFEVEAPCSGTLLATVVEERVELVVGDLLAWIGEPGETPPKTDPSDGSVAQRHDDLPITVTAEPIRPRIRATPVVLRLAITLGVDITTVTGTGPNGRITRDDVERSARRAPDADGSR